MYRCSICPAVSAPGQKKIVHRIYRPNGDIDREFGVCSTCKQNLAAGHSVERLVREFGGPLIVDKTPRPAPVYSTGPAQFTAPAATVAAPLPPPPISTGPVQLGGRRGTVGLSLPVFKNPPLPTPAKRK